MSEAAKTAIRQLEAARQVVLADASHYSVIIPGILPIIGPQAEVEVRRWGAEFLAEAFASPLLSSHAKEGLSIQALSLLNQLLEVPDQDDIVLKSVVQTAASVYALVFKYIASNPTDASSWHLMAGIKSNILKRFDTAPIGVRICCIRFAQRVVQVQTPGVINDPRKTEANEVSLAIVSREHPLIPPPHLEAEASGLLDRLLNIFYEENADVLLVDATLNGLAALIRARPTTANKIVSAVLTFNPFRRAPPNLSPLERVQIQSLERTTSAFLLNYTRKNQNNAHSSRIANKLSLLKSQRASFIDNKKRGHPVELVDMQNANKRIRLDSNVNGPSSFPTLPPGPVSVAQLYTLTTDNAVRSFDVQALPVDLVTRIVIPIIQAVQSSPLDEAINAIRARYLDLTRKPLQTPLDDAGDDDYEPEFEPMEDKEQIINKIDQLPEEDVAVADIDLGPFQLPQPQPLAYDEAEQLGKVAISRVFTMASHIGEPEKAARPEKSGLNRLAGSNFDKDAWLTILTRLATRATPELLGDAEDASSSRDEAILLRMQQSSLGDGIRQTLWKYVVEDFRHRIDVAISWLNEEWYNDRVTQLHLAQRESDSKPPSSVATQPNYEKWVLKLLDAIIPFLDANDKVLVRFLGEIPEVSQTVLDRVKAMARDPDRVSLTVKAIYYLVAFKPPCKQAAIDALEDLWNNYTEARASVKPLLAKIRPSAIAGSSAGANGVKPDPGGGAPAAVTAAS